MSSPLLPLLALVVNALLVVVAGFAGGIGLLLAGEWGIVALGVAAAVVFPLALVALHWLRWLIDIPAMLASDARQHWLAALLAYVAGVFVSALVLGWPALAFWWIAGAAPAWAALAWGYALVAGPLLLVIVRPFGYPFMVLLAFLAQLAYPLAWGLLHLAGVAPENIVAGIGVLALVCPLIEFSRRWQETTAPD